jgi:hypothetical protein
MAEPETIHAHGEVIPPGGPATGQPPGPRDLSGIALLIAVLADLLQLVLFPLFVEGTASPLNDALDVAVGLAMVKLIGWHWAFLPSFLGKLIPILDEFPCWTMAVLYVRSERAKLQTA